MLDWDLWDGAAPLVGSDTDQAVGQRAVRHHIELYRAIEQQKSELAAEKMRDHLQFLDEHAATVHSSTEK
ncbi:FCD domain-containing protein [Rhodococcus koreensis]